MREYKVGHTVTLTFKGEEEDINKATIRLHSLLKRVYGSGVSVRSEWVTAGKELEDDAGT